MFAAKVYALQFLVVVMFEFHVLVMDLTSS